MSGATAVGGSVDLGALRERWAAAWPAAVALWSPFTRLRPPAWCLTAADEGPEGLAGGFALIPPRGPSGGGRGWRGVSP